MRRRPPGGRPVSAAGPEGVAEWGSDGSAGPDAARRSGLRRRLEGVLARRAGVRVQPLVERLPLGDAVDDLQERLGAGVHDVGADAPAAEVLALVLDLDDRLALGVLAGGDAADAVVAHLHL